MSSELQLRVPKIQLTELSFTQPTLDAFQQWQESLPKANLGELSRQLYHCFLEFNQLDISPEKRLQLLEELRPLAYFTLEGLNKHYLNSSLSLNAHQRKAANLAQSLQNHLAVGYKHVVLGLIQSGNLTPLATALHRALTELSLTFLRACHLYCPTPAHLWLETHQLFKLAHQHQLLAVEVPDNENTPSSPLSLLDTYKRALLFSLSNSNHLRQKEQQRVFSACSIWCHDARLTQEPEESLFAVDLNIDRAPNYKSLFQGSDARQLWWLDTQQLRDKIAKYAESDASELSLLHDFPTGIDQSMLRYLTKSWGPMQSRSFQRESSEGTLQLALGFSAIHYYLSGQEEFSLWLENQGSNRPEQYQPGSGGSDAWSHAVDVSDDDLRIRHAADSTIELNQPPSMSSALTEEYPLFDARQIDSSPGGYSILWEEEIPAQLQSGELLAIRDNDQHWNLAVVRWLRLLGSQKVSAGLQLLAPNIRPGAIAVVHKSGGLSQYMRCFLLPALSATGQQASLLTPRISFQVGYKVRVVDEGLIHTVRLVECCEQTGSFAQFHFHSPQTENPLPRKRQPELKEQPSTPSDDHDFDNLWDKL